MVTRNYDPVAASVCSKMTGAQITHGAMATLSYVLWIWLANGGTEYGGIVGKSVINQIR